MSLKLAFLAIVLSADLELPAEAHDIYLQLADPAGVSCCNDHDCRPAPYRVTATGVQMSIDGDWIDVPDETIQYRALPGDNGETGGGHWCGRTHDGHRDRVFYVTLCAVLPPNATSVTQPTRVTTKNPANYAGPSSISPVP
jgi:hypothetical protein